MNGDETTPLHYGDTITLTNANGLMMGACGTGLGGDKCKVGVVGKLLAGGPMYAWTVQSSVGKAAGTVVKAGDSVVLKNAETSWAGTDGLLAVCGSITGAGGQHDFFGYYMALTPESGSFEGKTWVIDAHK